MKEDAVFSSLCALQWIFATTAWVFMQVLAGSPGGAGLPFVAHYALAAVGGLLFTLVLGRGEACLKNFCRVYFSALLLWYLVCCGAALFGQSPFSVNPALFSWCLGLICPLSLWFFFVSHDGHTGLAMGTVMTIGNLFEIVLNFAMPQMETFVRDADAALRMYQFFIALTGFSGLSLFLALRRTGNRPSPPAARDKAGWLRTLAWIFLSAALYFTFCGMELDTPLAGLSQPGGLPEAWNFLLVPLPLLAGLWYDGGKKQYIFFAAMLVCVWVAYGVTVHSSAYDACDAFLRETRGLFFMVLLLCGWELPGERRTVLFPLVAAGAQCLCAFHCLGMFFARLFETVRFPWLLRSAETVLLLGSSLTLFLFIRRLRREMPRRGEPAFPSDEKTGPADASSCDAVTEGVRRLIRQYGLNRRETEILKCLLRGLGTDEIAANLRLKRNTIRHYLYLLFRKTGVESRVQLVSLVNAPGRVRK
jgi:DNA-binding CsgD family transcriptional regulator